LASIVFPLANASALSADGSVCVDGDASALPPPVDALGVFDGMCDASAVLGAFVSALPHDAMVKRTTDGTIALAIRIRDPHPDRSIRVMIMTRGKPIWFT
jgi:hypothetical protein